jgi:hypothetical protein
MIETVVLLDANNVTVSVPLSWTDAGEVDACTAIASRRSWFRIVDLVRLVPLVEQLINRTEVVKGV